MKQIIIVGAGAAGMLAAIHAKTKDNQVILIERNTNCGKKILITGNGKCNYLNDDFNNIPSLIRSLKSSLLQLFIISFWFLLQLIRLKQLNFNSNVSHILIVFCSMIVS